jgi:transcriptional regulator with XRE-family HTH domain
MDSIEIRGIFADRRRELGLIQSELGKRARLSREMVLRFETGEKQGMADAGNAPALRRGTLPARPPRRDWKHSSKRPLSFRPDEKSGIWEKMRPEMERACAWHVA